MGVCEATAGLEARPFSDETEADALGVVNAMTAGWPYCRPVDAELAAYWRARPEALQAEHMLVAYRGRTAVAFLHGERDGAQHNIHIVAMLRGEVDAGAWLLESVERRARAEGVARICGPHWRSGGFYGGYILGREPYHPHWGNDATEAFVRSGFIISHPAVILVADRMTAAPPGDAPKGYEIVDARVASEFGASAFRYAAIHAGQEVATCAARLYPALKSPSGGPVGQVGYVGTDDAHQGKGLATYLTRLGLERLFRMGAADVLIATGLENYPALRAYEKAGFRRRYNINEWSRRLA